VSRRRGLGRGLDALLEPERVVRSLPLSQLKPNRLQPRSDFDEEGLTELATSIRAQGIVQPIVVTQDGDGGYLIVAGERRWRAARRAGLDEVPVVVREVADDRELLEAALVENLQRSDLNPLEEAEAYRMLKDRFELSQEEIAVRVGKGRSTVANRLRLLRLPDEVQDLLRADRLSAGQALPLVAMESEEHVLRLAKKAAAQGWSARQVEKRAAGRKGGGRRRQPQDPDTAAAAERLTRRLQTRVEIRRGRRGGTVSLHFHSEEELMRLYELLMGQRGRS
jgi:ParB family chromosome partitioning protein